MEEKNKESVSVRKLRGHCEPVSAPQALQRIQLGLVDQVTEGGSAGTSDKAASQPTEQQPHDHARWACSHAQSDTELHATDAGCHSAYYTRNRAGSAAGFPGVMTGADMDRAAIWALQNH
ncbi:hypothetical protein [Alloalcanivorax venustensis]|uniref:hypothetical protein n=1 Tax=Alloalcanivorax venustensis TaxID=172371 RepID=UPI0035123EF3